MGLLLGFASVACTADSNDVTGSHSNSDLPEEESELLTDIRRTLTEWHAGPDLQQCIGNVSEAVAELMKVDEQENTITVQHIREMWNFTNGTNLGFPVAEIGKSCANTEEIFCSLVFAKTIAKGEKCFETMCDRVSYIHALLQPLLEDSCGSLSPWLALIETRSCDFHGFDRYEKCISRNSSGRSTAFSCPSPLKRTSVPSRASIGLEERLKSAKERYFVPTGYRKDCNDTFHFYPCGNSCELINPDAIQTKLVDALVRISSLCHLFIPILSVAACFRAGLHKMCTYPNRLHLYLLLSIFLFGMFTIPRAYSPQAQSLGCHGDGTEMPRPELKSNSLCVFTLVIQHFGRQFFYLTCLFVAIAWWQLVVGIALKMGQWYQIQIQGRFEIIWFTLTLLWSGGVPVLIVHEDVFVFPVLDFCETIDERYEHLAFAPVAASVFVTLVVLVDGLRRLRKVKHTSEKFRQSSLPKEMSGSKEKYHGLTLLVKKLRGYIIGLSIMATLEVITSALPIERPSRIDQDLVHRQRLFLTCMIRTCGDLSTCVHLEPNLVASRTAMSVFFSLHSIAITFIICWWAFSPDIWRGRRASTYRSTSQVRTASNYNSRFSVSTHSPNSVLANRSVTTQVTLTSQLSNTSSVNGGPASPKNKTFLQQNPVQSTKFIDSREYPGTRRASSPIDELSEPIIVGNSSAS